MGRISSVVVALLLLLVELVVGVRLSLLDGPVRKQTVNRTLLKDFSVQTCTHPPEVTVSKNNKKKK